MEETFTLVLRNDLSLSQGGYCIDTTLNSQAKYQINFDALFNKRQYLYKKCQIRPLLISEKSINTPLANTVGGVCIVGLGAGNSLGTYGLEVISPLAPQNSSAVEAGGYFYNIGGNSLNKNGVQLTQIPIGIQNITVEFRSVLNAIIQPANIPNYNLTLFFDFYDPVQPKSAD